MSTYGKKEALAYLESLKTNANSLTSEQKNSWASFVGFVVETTLSNDVRAMALVTTVGQDIQNCDIVLGDATLGLAEKIKAEISKLPDPEPEKAAAPAPAPVTPTVISGAGDKDKKVEAPAAPAPEEKKADPAPAPKQILDPVRTLQEALVYNGFELKATRSAKDGVDGKFGRDTACKTKGALDAILDHANSLEKSGDDQDKAAAAELKKGVKAAAKDLEDGKPTAETADFIAEALDEVDPKVKEAHDKACVVAERRSPSRNQERGGDSGGERRPRHGGGGRGIDYGAVARRVTDSQGYVSAETVRQWHKQRGLDPRNPKWDTSIASFGRDHRGHEYAHDLGGIEWSDTDRMIDAARGYSARNGHRSTGGSGHRYVGYNPYGGSSGQKEVIFAPPEYTVPETGSIGVTAVEVPHCGRRQRRNEEGGCEMSRGGGRRRHVPGHIRHIPDDVGGGGADGGASGSSGSGGPGAGSSCFIAGTSILMANGSYKPVELLQVGDVLKGESRDNTVIATPMIPLAGRTLYGFNGSDAFVTAGHPFMTDKGWSAIDPAHTIMEKHGVIARKLEVGDTIITEQGTMLVLSIDAYEAAATADGQMVSGGGVYLMSQHSFVYNPMLDGDHTYYAAEYLVHNKGGSGGGN